MDRNKPIASQYNLGKLEKLVLNDIERLEAQLAALRSVEVDVVRSSTIDKYKVMVGDRQELLALIKEQAQQFSELAPRYSEVS